MTEENIGLTIQNLEFEDILQYVALPSLKLGKMPSSKLLGASKVRRNDMIISLFKVRMLSSSNMFLSRGFQNPKKAYSKNTDLVVRSGLEVKV